MSWCEANGVDYIFGLSGDAVLDRLVEAAADNIRELRAEAQHSVLRGYARRATLPNPGPGSAASRRASRPARTATCCAGASISSRSIITIRGWPPAAERAVTSRANVHEDE
jgi:hypothetical protein